MAEDFVALFTGRLVPGHGKRSALYRCWGYEDFAAKKRELAAQGLQLLAFDVDDDGGAKWYTGAWIESREDNWFCGLDSPQKFKEDFESRGSRGMVDLNVFRDAQGTVWHTGISLGKSSAQRLDVALNWTDFLASQQRHATEGFGIVKVQGVEDARGRIVYSALYEQGRTNSGLYLASDWRQFLANYQGTVGNCTPMTYQVLERPSDSLRHYLGSYAPHSSFKYLMRETWEQFTSQWRALTSQGWVLVSIEVQHDPTSWDAALRKAYGARAVGYSFVVGDGKKVVEQGGAGWAIRPDPVTYPGGVAMSGDTVLTLGSISKTLGAVTVLHMIESGDHPGLGLESKVFDLLEGHQGIDAGILKDLRVRNVTLRHLLTMTAGLQEAPAVGNLLEPAAFWNYIRAYLGQEVDEAWLDPDGKPGQVYSYSNSAYLAVRAIIEVLACCGYESKEQQVLARAGLNPERTRLPVVGQGYPVRYYGPDGKPAEGATIANEASWLSTANEMALLLQAFRPTSTGKGVFQGIYETMAVPHSVKYQVENSEGKWKRIESPVNTFIGFDALWGDPVPTFRTKNGTYSGLSSAQILCLQDPACDIVYQSNTESVSPQAVLLNQSVFTKPGGRS